MTSRYRTDLTIIGTGVADEREEVKSKAASSGSRKERAVSKQLKEHPPQYEICHLNV